MKQYPILIIILFILPFVANAQKLMVKLTEHTANVEAIAYSPDGKYFASSGWDGTVNLYTIDSLGFPNFKQSFKGHLGAITSLKFSADSKMIVSCGKDYSARLWNIDFPDSSKTFNLHYEPVTNAFLDHSGKILITCSKDGTIRNTSIYDVKKTKSIKVGKSINDVVMSKDGKYYYVAVKGGTILKIEIGSRKTVNEFVGHKDEVNSLDLSPDGRFLASGSNDKTIIVWDLANSKELKKLVGFEWKVTSVEYSLDGRYILGGCNDGTIKLFDVESGKIVSEFMELGKNVRDVAFSPNEQHIAAATNLEPEDLEFGAVIYNSGVTYVKPEAVYNSKGTRPTVRKTGKPVVKPKAKPAPVK